jgi:para-nitrobenzyl esterase
MQGASFAPGSAAEGPQSEDCLYLNVYTPGVDSRKRPVMFFIHGGAFVVGSSSMPLYDGGRLAEMGDVVVVTTNYRVGALGYLCLGDMGASWGATANVGALDQIAALRWVARNIDRFGGDPNSVTVFGESAGATSVCHLLATPSAEGLFQKAIAESPGNALGIPEPAAAIEVAEQVLAKLGIAPGDSEKLRELPAEDIVRAQASVKSSLWVGFFPVLDSNTVPRRPKELFAEGGGARVPLVIGTNRDEWNLFEPPKVEKVRSEDGRLVSAVLERGFPKRHEGRIPELVGVYRRSRSQLGLPDDDGSIVRAVAGDLRFRIPSIRFAEAHVERGLPTYMYLFTHGSPAMRGALGSCHALELPFVFGMLDAPLQDRFAGQGPGVEALSSAMMRSWLAFTKTGDPNAHDAAEWIPYDADRRSTLILDSTAIRTENAPLDAERAAWDGVL